MRFEMTRHLAGVMNAGIPGFGQRTLAAKSLAVPSVRTAPPEMDARQGAIFLLSTAAEVEHALMVQYLYAAYSIDVSAASKSAFGPRDWQRVILGVAKEEMGHLITVQNVLRLLGGPLHLQRDPYPVTTPFFPYAFHLEPLSAKSLAKFVVAESPETWPSSVPAGEKAEIEALAVDGEGGPVVRVGKLYGQLIAALGLAGGIDDSDFRGGTYPYQASFDEYGRGYAAGARGDPRRSPAAGPVNRAVRAAGAWRAPPRVDPQVVAAGPADSADSTPDVLVIRVGSRAEAIAALSQIADQGEAVEKVENDSEDSHFTRFLRVYREFKRYGGSPPVLPLAADPVVSADAAGGRSEIKNPEAAKWGALFNIRYRMLLAYLAHTYRHRSIAAAMGAPSRRGQLINRMFGEMYNLKAIACLLGELPLDRDPKLRAGPPFEMPYTVALPEDEEDVWRLHRDLLVASTALASGLAQTSKSGGAYAHSLLALDQRAKSEFETILSGLRTSAQFS
jgi:hypothetical protein